MTHRFIHYPGHLGPRPQTEFPGQNAGILWDAPIKRVRQPYADALIRESGFQLALDLDEMKAETGIPKKRLRELLDSGQLDAATYHPRREGEPPVEVIVIPPGLSPLALARLLEDQEEEKSD